MRLLADGEFCKVTRASLHQELPVDCGPHTRDLLAIYDRIELLDGDIVVAQSCLRSAQGEDQRFPDDWVLLSPQDLDNQLAIQAGTDRVVLFDRWIPKGGFDLPSGAV